MQTKRSLCWIRCLSQSKGNYSISVQWYKLRAVLCGEDIPYEIKLLWHLGSCQLCRDKCIKANFQHVAFIVHLQITCSHALGMLSLEPNDQIYMQTNELSSSILPGLVSNTIKNPVNISIQILSRNLDSLDFKLNKILFTHCGISTWEAHDIENITGNRKLKHYGKSILQSIIYFDINHDKF